MDNRLIQLLANESVLHDHLSGVSSTALLIIVVFCIAILSKGADWLVDGAVDLAKRTGLPEIVIGATVISLGTTLPEAFVSVMAAFMGNPGLALGNGVGSIIADTGLIFGLSCILATIPANRYILDRTGWVQVGAATLLVVIAVIALKTSPPGIPPMLDRWVGFLFLGLLVCYLYMTYSWAKASGKENEIDDTHQPKPLKLSWLMVLGGLFLVISGARVLVPSSSEVAMRIGVPDDVIAATMVAFGTSLPELMTAITAIRKGHPEITVGNIVGADVLNCLFVIGAAAAATPLEIPRNFFYFHFPTMLLILYSFRFFISTNKTGVFKRFHGVWLLGIYGAYVIGQYSIN